MDLPPRLLEKFWAHVCPEPNTGCWLFDGYLSEGSPRFKFLGKPQHAQRVSYCIHVRPIDDSECVGITCGQPFCVNPDHIYAHSRHGRRPDTNELGCTKCGGPRDRAYPNGTARPVCSACISSATCAVPGCSRKSRDRDMCPPCLRGEPPGGPLQKKRYDQRERIADTNWLFISRDGKNDKGRILATCECAVCGYRRQALLCSFRQGQANCPQCEPIGARGFDRTGCKFSDRTIIGRAEGYCRWLVRCDECGHSISEDSAEIAQERPCSACLARSMPCPKCGGPRESLRGWCRSCSVTSYRKSRKKYRLSHKDKMRAYMREWCRRNPDKVRAKSKRRRAALAGASGSHTEQEWVDCKLMHRNRCACCDIHIESTPEKKLTEDHVLAITRGGSDYIWNTVPACLSCNSSKCNRDKMMLPEHEDIWLLRQPSNKDVA